MKNINKLILLGALLLTVSCKKEDKVVTPSSGGGGGTVSKAMLSSWAVDPSSAFSVRFDVAGNLTGTTFTMVLKCSDSGEVHCPGTTLNGDNDFGTFNVPSNCTHAVPGSANICASFVTMLQTGGVGSYTNSGGSLTLCKFNTSCSTYH